MFEVNIGNKFGNKYCNKRTKLTKSSKNYLIVRR